MDTKYCRGCRNDFYNGNNNLNVKKCWHLKDAKIVWRIPVGHWERPPYKKRKVRIPDCYYHDQGSNRTHYIDPDTQLDSRGYWR